MHYSEFSAEKPKEVEFEALQPIQLAPSIFAPERHRDTYSEYEDPKNSFHSICIACAMESNKAVGQVSGSWDFRAA